MLTICSSQVLMLIQMTYQLETVQDAVEDSTISETDRAW